MNQNMSSEISQVILGIVCFEILTLSISVAYVGYFYANWTVAIIVAALYLIFSFYYVSKNKEIIGLIPTSIIWTEIIAGSFIRNPSFISAILGVVVFVVTLGINSFLWKFGNRLENEGKHFNSN